MRAGNQLPGQAPPGFRVFALPTINQQFASKPTSDVVELQFGKKNNQQKLTRRSFVKLAALVTGVLAGPHKRFHFSAIATCLSEFGIECLK